jgi:biopolymer transport protein ExbB
MNLLFLQDTATIAIDAAGKAEKELSYIGLLISGGGFMIPIGILSLLAFYITIERYLAIKKAGEIDPKFMLNIKDFVTHGNIDAALALAKQTNTPIARLIEKGIKRIGRPLNDISTAIENEGKLEVYKLERSLPLLATVAGAAPMIGFFGNSLGNDFSF